MELLDNKWYQDDVRQVAQLPLPWEKLTNSTLLITGATGLIGSFLVDVLMLKRKEEGLTCTVYTMNRRAENARKRFAPYLADGGVHCLEGDVNQDLRNINIPHVDFVLHLASNTHPRAYATDPIGTVTTNIIGTNNLLQLAKANSARRFLFASSVEIYGENRGDVDCFSEDYCGYINCNTLRAGYPESKRCGESLCQAYRKQESLEVVIARLSRSFGPTLRRDDSKALSQFLHNALNGEDIVLKSKGLQYYSYTYVADAVSGLLTVLLLGEDGEAYNVADAGSDIRLKDLAAYIANEVGRTVIFQLPDSTEQAGFSKATLARMDSSKLQSLGWKAHYDIREGIHRTLHIMKECGV